MQHLEEGTIHAWLDGALSPAEAREVEQHVAECTECSGAVAEARGLIAGASRVVSSLDVVRGNVIPKQPAAAAGAGKSLWRSLHLTPSRAALAATLLIAISSILTVRHDTPNKIVMQTRAATSQVSAPAPVAAQGVGSPPFPAPTVASSAPDRQVPAPRAKDQQAAAAASRKEEAKAADAIERRDIAETRAKASLDSSRIVDKPSVVAAAPLAPPAPRSTAGAMANVMDTSASEKKALAKVAPADSARSANANEARQRLALENNLTVRTTSMREPGRSDAKVSATSTCFEFTPGTVVSSNLPLRFALESSPGDTAQHIVRAITQDGRLDSVLTGSTWTRVTPNEITVRFGVRERAMTLPIRDASAAAAPAVIERSQFAGQNVASVFRVACRP